MSNRTKAELATENQQLRDKLLEIYDEIGDQLGIDDYEDEEETEEEDEED